MMLRTSRRPVSPEHPDTDLKLHRFFCSIAFSLAGNKGRSLSLSSVQRNTHFTGVYQSLEQLILFRLLEKIGVTDFVLTSHYLM